MLNCRRLSPVAVAQTRPDDHLVGRGRYYLGMTPARRSRVPEGGEVVLALGLALALPPLIPVAQVVC